jgi:transposase InsO family protein
VVGQLKVSERAACRALGQPRSSQRYVARERDGEAALRARMRELALRHPRYGYRRVGAVLRREGFKVNHKRMRRLWRAEGLKVPRKQRKKRRLPGGGGDNACGRRRAERVDQVWAFDFCFDRTSDGRTLKILSVVDEFTRRCLAIRAGRRITGGDVVSVLEALVKLNRGRGPEHVRCDNGPEFACAALRAWSARANASGWYIAPGSPWENGVVESYHARLRDELLDREEFATVDEARGLLEVWREEYNNERPHGSLGYKTPAAFAAELAAACAAAARVAVPDPAPLRCAGSGTATVT